MATGIDNLSIQITASTKSAVKAVNSLADALKGLSGQLNNLNTGNLEQATQAAQGLSSAVQTLGNSAGAIQNVSQSLQQVGQQATNIAQTSNATQQLTQAAQQAAQATQQAAQSAQQFTQVGNNGSRGFGVFKQNLIGIKDALKDFASDMQAGARGIIAFGDRISGALSKVFPNANKAASGMRSLRKESNKTALTSKGLAKELLRVSKMLKLMITRMALRAIIKEVGNGFKSLALHSAEFDASMSSMINGSKKLSYSFSAMVSPLINALAPALVYVINLLVKFLNIINQVFSALSGSNTWNRAKDFTGSWADSIKDANKKAKELKKTVLGFDELNQLQEKYTSGGDTSNNIVDMFETVDIENKWKSLAKNLKKYWDKFLAPIKKAWANAGDYVKESWINAFNAVKNLVSDIASDFLKVWTQPATVRMLENLFKIIGNIGQLVTNLANSFDRAWNKASVGKHIFEDIRDLCAIVIEYVERITASWADWAKTIDFSPLLESTEKWLDSLKAPVEFLMGVISDLNEHFVQPLTKWLVESGIPDLIQVFTDFNNKVDWDLLRTRLDKIITALGKFTESLWSGFVMFVSDIADELADGLNSDAFGAFVDVISDFLTNIDAQEVYDALKLIFDGFLLYKGLTFLVGISEAITTIVTTIKTVWPILRDFATYCSEGFVVGISLAWDKYMSGTIFDWNEWQGTIKKIVDYLGILWNNIVMFASYPIVFFGEEDPTNAFQSFEEYNNAISILEENNKSIAGSYDEVINRAKTLQKELNNATTSMTGDAKILQHDYFDPLESSAKALYGTSETVAVDMKKNYAGMTRDIKLDLETLEKGHKDTTDTIKKSFDKKNWTFSGIADGLKESFGKAKDAIKGIWNGIADSVNGNHSFFGSSFSINLPKIYASGGFPEDGLFMANHGELVGRFSNGRTAVANNEQITAGIAQAVYSAMISANSGGGGSYINNTIEIDGVAIARAVTKGQRSIDRRYSPTMA